MHIEPGILSGAKIAAANLAAIALVAAQAPQLLRKPQLVLRTLLAALFFSVFMQSFHLPAPRGCTGPGPPTRSYTRT